ncbi:transketolase family protein [Inhella sp.]|uniref:transketolase family protein n=1 Tax=Inhella sp. TaxID=1921806 RepID=UPI0035B16DAE
MRNAFIEELCALAAQNERIVLMVGDLGWSVVEPFAERFPQRFFNAGVAEQNMTGLAAGLASEGFHVFTYSIANFPTFRCAEQLRNDVAYHGLPVTVVSVGGGLAYGNLGYSHHAVQDYALMRTLPGMTLAAPGCPMEVRACLRHLVSQPRPSYLRLGKAGEPAQHAAPPALESGRWLPIRPGLGRRALVSTGAALAAALDWQARPDHADCAVFSLPLWGMEAKGVQAEQIAAYDEVIALEDHLPDGGFGAWLLEAASQSSTPGLAARIRLRALDAKVCGEVGSQAALNRLGGLTPPV